MSLLDFMGLGALWERESLAQVRVETSSCCTMGHIYMQRLISSFNREVTETTQDIEPHAVKGLN